MLALLQKDIRQQMAEKAKTGDLKAVNGSAAAAAAKRKRRWDQTAEANQTPTNTTPKKMSSWDQADSTAEVTGLI
jgi:splicing factor 3B subunit 1